MSDSTVTEPEGREQSAIPHAVTGGDERGLLRRLRTPRRPRLWFEILLIGVSYWTYSLIRNAVPEQKSEALRNADWIWKAEHQLGIAVEGSVNRTVDSVTWLIVGMNYYYATLHFVVPISVLVWLYWKRPEYYRSARTVIFAETGLALIGFFFYPLAPPRMLPGFIDTVVTHGTWGSGGDSGGASIDSVSNQFAAMPSLHIGWSVWCALTIAHIARRRWVKVLGLLYPVFTFTVIIATANHYVLDAVGGLVVLAGGFAIQWLITGRSTFGERPPLPPKEPSLPRPQASVESRS